MSEKVQWSARSPLDGADQRVELSCDDDIMRTYLPIERASWLNLDVIMGCAEGARFALQSSYMKSRKEMRFRVGREGYVPGKKRMKNFAARNELALNDPRLSRHHCAFILDQEGIWHVKDLDSRNGTRVNGERIKPEGRAPLYPGYQIRVGDSVFCVEGACYAMLKRVESKRYYTSERRENNMLATLIDLVDTLECHRHNVITNEDEDVRWEVDVSWFLFKLRNKRFETLRLELERQLLGINEIADEQLVCARVERALEYVKALPLYQGWEQL